MLLGRPSEDESTKLEKDHIQSWEDLPKHHDEDQVQLDVNRSFIYYPNGMQLLFLLSQITTVLTHNSHLHRPVSGSS